MTRCFHESVDMTAYPIVTIELPDWIDATLSRKRTVCPTMADRMALVIDLAGKNVAEGTGGPFGSGIFEMESGRLVAPGVNLVETANNSVAHAEITAIMVAQKILGTYDLGQENLPAMELVTSTEPCAMCLGAVIWSGVKRLTCAARDEDARRIGFDEGPKPDDWTGELHKRGIALIRDVRREEAIAVLEQYGKSGGLIYNATR